ncbi:alpha-hydroxy acid oxidase [Saccharopolyspora phatthalungensis]|uniref:L-lactate dehydrogenase (Cytochrome) n=1 Tax=Saccharopolyspora phatthalungensis TaxID=664693 RepID=A0A840Q7P8_9PSEU|nr:alpha-hydroxy acid oxidase [Saccharopolyspora phatthalungensis]MBB5156476.1 L-lactate dehydrogenase (cytochrome) [Saccharopolyspora phatthalungensis]
MSALEKARRARLARLLNHEDARRAAARALPRGIREYIEGGAEDEVTLRRNAKAFRDIAFRPRMATWVDRPDLTTTVLGTRIALPVLTAPCGGMRLVHPDGDIGLATAASRAGSIHVASSAAGFTLEQIAEVQGPQWFQVYRFSSRSTMEHLVHRAQAAGYSALVATVDTAVSGYRERDFKNGFSYSMRVNARNAVKLAPQLVRRPAWLARYVLDGLPFEIPNTAQITADGKPMMLTEMTKGGAGSHSPTWTDVDWLRANWRGPLVVKGLLTAEDARRAVDAGADAVIVSNHGGRQLDGAPATLHVLPRIVEAVGDTAEVLMDSGIRRGSDVLKALSLGAKAVLVGRLPTWGLAAGGTAGVERVLELLRSEMVRTMRLMGCRSVSELDPSWLGEDTIPLHSNKKEVKVR